MSWWDNGGKGALILLLAAGLLQAHAQDETQTIKGFRVPEYDEDGRMKSQLFGGVARLLPNGVVEVTDASVEIYNDKGDVEARVSAPHCLYDRAGNRAGSKSDVRITRENLSVTGKGFVWTAKSQTFVIHSDVKVVLKEAQRTLKEKNDHAKKP